MLEMGMTFGYAQYVADNEMVRMLRRLLQGIPVNDESMAVDVIKQVGAGGHFLMEDHTMTHMKSAHVSPRLIDRTNRDAWIEQGKPNLIGKAKEEVLNILATQKPDPLPEKVASEIRSTIEQIEKELGIK
ncbi:hypothetical protein DCMF_07920 [Candidatus Formimonas warabiya]|uniref:Trimethylamine methyltransferase n=1 Tax=Formimonas warabiya TaxID=1761012 RepID=A0A3G1L1B9_FORW1|nr:hypothetical protein DCMF_07920 [Candidatus Formimonas warabiya]